VARGLRVDSMLGNPYRAERASVDSEATAGGGIGPIQGEFIGVTATGSWRDGWEGGLRGWPS
jgi:hypothetical protein